MEHEAAGMRQIPRRSLHERKPRGTKRVPRSIWLLVVVTCCLDLNDMFAGSVSTTMLLFKRLRGADHFINEYDSLRNVLDSRSSATASVVKIVALCREK
jgi:hypothetical protein